MATTKKRASARVARGEGETSSETSSFFENSRLSIHDEKEALTGLNSRLAQYIDKVRQLEQENRTLTVKIKDIEVVEKKEKKDLNSRFEAERSRLRDALEGRNADMAKLQVERDSAVAELDDLKGRLVAAERTARLEGDGRRRAESLLDDATNRALRAANDAKKFEAENKDLVKEVQRLRDALEVAKRSLEEEAVLRSTLQTKLESSLEDVEFQNQNLKMQLEEESRKRQVEMTTVSRQLENEYEDRLQEKLAEGRALLNEELAAHRARFDTTYVNKLNAAQDQAERARESEREARMRLREWEMNSSAFEARNSELEKKVNDLQRQLQGEQELRRAQIADKEQQLSELMAELGRMAKEYEETVGIKLQLDNELRAYQSLLEGEESRLNLSSTRSPRVTTRTLSTASHSTTRGGVKRHRVDDDISVHRVTTRLENHQTGPIKIVEVAESGEYIRLQNTSEEDVHVGGWIVTVAADKREVSYKFHSKAVLKPDATVTIWSQTSGHVHQPPHDILMKSQSWPSSASPEAKLEDSEGDRVAWQELVTSDFHNSSSSDPNDRCSIM